MNADLNFLKQNNEGIVLTVKIIPNSSSDSVLGYTDEYLKLKITAPPNENKANKHLILFLSKLFNIPKSKILFISGEKSKLKRVILEDISLEKLNNLILIYDKIDT